MTMLYEWRKIMVCHQKMTEADNPIIKCYYHKLLLFKMAHYMARHGLKTERLIMNRCYMDGPQ